MPQHPDQTKRDIALDAMAGPAAGGRSWFFGIGINKYTYFPPLNNAVIDVSDLVALLQKENDLAPKTTCTLYDEEATRRNIISTLDRRITSGVTRSSLYVILLLRQRLAPFARRSLDRVRFIF